MNRNADSFEEMVKIADEMKKMVNKYNPVSREETYEERDLDENEIPYDSIIEMKPLPEEYGSEERKKEEAKRRKREYAERGVRTGEKEETIKKETSSDERAEEYKDIDEINRRIKEIKDAERKGRYVDPKADYVVPDEMEGEYMEALREETLKGVRAEIEERNMKIEEDKEIKELERGIEELAKVKVRRKKSISKKSIIKKAKVEREYEVDAEAFDDYTRVRLYETKTKGIESERKEIGTYNIGKRLTTKNEVIAELKNTKSEINEMFETLIHKNIIDYSGMSLNERQIDAKKYVGNKNSNFITAAKYVELYRKKKKDKEAESISRTKALNKLASKELNDLVKKGIFVCMDEQTGKYRFSIEYLQDHRNYLRMGLERKESISLKVNPLITDIYKGDIEGSYFYITDINGLKKSLTDLEHFEDQFVVDDVKEEFVLRFYKDVLDKNINSEAKDLLENDFLFLKDMFLTKGDVNRLRKIKEYNLDADTNGSMEKLIKEENKKRREINRLFSKRRNEENMRNLMIDFLLEGLKKECKEEESFDENFYDIIAEKARGGRIKSLRGFLDESVSYGTGKMKEIEGKMRKTKNKKKKERYDDQREACRETLRMSQIALEKYCPKLAARTEEITAWAGQGIIKNNYLHVMGNRKRLKEFVKEMENIEEDAKKYFTSVWEDIEGTESFGTKGEQKKREKEIKDIGLITLGEKDGKISFTFYSKDRKYSPDMEEMIKYKGIDGKKIGKELLPVIKKIGGA